MIDFRYHLVSIVAVFLALAVGLVLGTTTLNGFVLDDLKGRVNGLRVDKQDLEDQVRLQEQRTAEATDALAAVAPTLVADRLLGLQVVVVSAPGTSASTREEVTALLGASGAEVTATVMLRASLTSGSAEGLAAVVGELDAAPQAPTPAAATAAAARLLGAALTAPVTDADADPDPDLDGAPSAGPSATPSPEPEPAVGPDAEDVLSGLAAGGFLDLGEAAPDAVAAPLVVLMGPSTPGPELTRLLLDLGTAADQAGAGVVLATGTAGAEDDAADTTIGVLRSGDAVGRISGVDHADTVAGAIAVVYALARELDGANGQYGTAPGASTVLPPAPAARTVAQDDPVPAP